MEKTLRLVPRAKLQVVERYSESRIPTRHGWLKAIVFREKTAARGAVEPVEHIAIVAGDPTGEEPVAVRVHSECWTGEVLGSLKCDCQAQLDHALDYVADAGRGVVLYLRQEGRGIGLGNKIRAYALQERGADTVDANRQLGFPDDLRSYEAAACMLAQLGVKRVRLITNNPAKIDELERLGVNVVSRIPSHASVNPHSAGYLETKRVRMGHLIEGQPTASAAVLKNGA